MGAPFLDPELFRFLRCVGIVAAADVATAATISIAKDLSSPLSTTAIARVLDTDGSKMAGTIVTVGFSNGTSQTEIWAATVPGSGEAVMLNFFHLGNTAVSSCCCCTSEPRRVVDSLTVNVGAGESRVRYCRPNPGTPGSSSGLNFSDLRRFLGGLVSVTYSRPVGLSGSTRRVTFSP